MSLGEERDDLVNESEVCERKNPLKIILGLFLLLLIVAMIVPYYWVESNPEPNVIVDYTLDVDGSNGSFNGLYDVYRYDVSKEVREAAAKIATSGCPSGIKICQAKAIYYFARDKIKYVSDPSTREYFQTPEATLFSKSGDCDDNSILLVGLYRAIGIESRIVTIPGHAYVQVRMQDAPRQYVTDGWINLDSTCGSCDFGEIPRYYNPK